MTVIHQHVHPAGGRELYVTKLEVLWDWQHFFEPVGLTFKGIAASHSAPDVCHSKRFVKRQDLQMLSLPGWEVLVPKVFETSGEQPDDVIMLTKEFWSSEGLAHAPMLVWNSDLIIKLDRFPTKACPRNTLSEDQLRQFRKTAAAVKEAPWNLMAASAYLTQWCDQNVLAAPGRAPPMRSCLGFLLSHETPCRWLKNALAIPTSGDRWLCYAPAAPVAITVQASAARKRALTTGLAQVAVAPRGKKVTKKVRPAAIQWVEEQQAEAPVDQSTVGAAALPALPPQAAPEPVAEVQGMVVAAVPAPAPRQLGCPKCKHSPKGCKQCKNPHYKPRGPRGAKAAK